MDLMKLKAAAGGIKQMGASETLTNDERKGMLHYFARSESWWFTQTSADQDRIVQAYRRGDSTLPYGQLSTHTTTPEVLQKSTPPVVKPKTVTQTVADLIANYQREATGPGPIWAGAAQSIVRILQSHLPEEAVATLRNLRRQCRKMSVSCFFAGAANELALAIRLERKAHQPGGPKTAAAVKQAKLTDLQTSVLAQLRAAGCDFVAEATERHWKRGESYYIDSRVNVSKRLRAAFNRANPEVK